MKPESMRVRQWREKNKKLCSSCGEVKIFPASTTCRRCARLRRSDLSKESTLGDVRRSLAVRGKHPSWMYSIVRGFARSWNKHLLTRPCTACGYVKHVELCHRKAIASFGDGATLKEINAERNVVALCRNCHWEFDHGFLKLGRKKTEQA